MSLESYAESELKMFFPEPTGEYGGMIKHDVMELIHLFSQQGHSGGSAPAVLSMFYRLAKYKPLTALTGNEDEWNEVSEDGTKQNKRCPSVFKRPDGSAYCIDARHFVDPHGLTYSSNDSIADITFPFKVPSKPEYVPVDEQGRPVSPIKSFSDYEKLCEDTKCLPDSGTMNGLIWSVLALAGETGEVAEQVKRISRDDNSVLTEERLRKIIGELGDVAFCLVACILELGSVAKQAGLSDVDLAKILNTNAEKMLNRKAHNTLHGEGGDR